MISMKLFSSTHLLDIHTLHNELGIAKRLFKVKNTIIIWNILNPTCNRRLTNFFLT